MKQTRPVPPPPRQKRLAAEPDRPVVGPPLAERRLPPVEKAVQAGAGAYRVADRAQGSTRRHPRADPVDRGSPEGTAVKGVAKVGVAVVAQQMGKRVVAKRRQPALPRPAVRRPQAAARHPLYRHKVCRTKAAFVRRRARLLAVGHGVVQPYGRHHVDKGLAETAVLLVVRQTLGVSLPDAVVSVRRTAEAEGVVDAVAV